MEPGKILMLSTYTMSVARKVVLKLLLLLLYWIKSILLFLLPVRFRHKKNVNDETVLVTGAGSGLGRLLALRFARLGSRLVLWDLDPVSVRETKDLVQDFTKKTVYAYQCDVSNKNQVREVAAKVKEEVGPVTILVNNVGILVGKSFMELTEEEIERVFDVNILSQMWTCRAFLPDMMNADHGHLVTVASVGGLFGCEKLTDYCASKYAVVGFEESLRLELRSSGFKGIKTTLVCPYFTRTGLFRGLDSRLVSELRPDYVADRIVQAVRLNQEVLILPRAMNLMVTLKTMLPVSAQLLFADVMGTKRMMRKFRGARPIPTRSVAEK